MFVVKRLKAGRPVDVSIDFNLVTLLDDVINMVANGLAWSSHFSKAMEKPGNGGNAYHASVLRQAAAAAAAATALTATSIHERVARGRAATFDRAYGSNLSSESRSSFARSFANSNLSMMSEAGGGVRRSGAQGRVRRAPSCREATTTRASTRRPPR